MASPSNLAVVLCHGSYHTSAPYDPLLEALQARGIAAHCPQLPTSDLAKLNVGDVESPDFDLEPPSGGYPQGKEDAEIIIDVLKPLVEAGKDVLLVGHSSGGWTATQAAQPDLQAKVRKGKGQAGGIIGILYIGAFIIPVGESIFSFFQPKEGPAVVPPFVTFHKHGFTGLATPANAEQFFFNDLDAEVAKKWAATLTASPVLTTELTNDAYSALPCAYLVLDEDQTLPRKYQEGMIGLQVSKTGSFEVYHSPSGHSPHLSWTEGVVNTIADFVRKIHAKEDAMSPE